MRRRRSRASAPRWSRPAAVLAALLGAAAVLGIVFAGSSQRLAGGTRIDGIDVGGLTSKQAVRLLESRFGEVQRIPVAFSAGGRTFHLRADLLGVRPDFSAAVAAARESADGFGPVRGYKRLGLRFFSEERQPKIRFWDQALGLKVAQLAARVDRSPREAALVRHGLSVELVPGRTGRVLDRAAADRLVVDALGSLSRSPGVIRLPVVARRPKIAAADLRPALRQARLALSAPVRLVSGSTAWRLPRWRLATLLELPADGRTQLRIGGPAATDYFGRLEKSVGHAPVDARFAVDGPQVRIVPSRPGVGLDVLHSVSAILAAATTPGNRTATLVTERTLPKRTTADAQKMGITGLVSSYETFYGGIPNRLHNVALVAHLIDGALIKPGQEFSFNKTTGERSAAKGFLEAPVIVNGELQTGLGGGVCQVSTTVFNAAFQAGLSITERTNHALYISHYPLGRDATVDYPNVDLRFVNDTGHWLLLRTFVGTGSLVVDLYGTPVHRKVEVDTAPLRVVAPFPVKKVKDPTLPKGQQVVEQAGVPAQATSVRRRVYAANGKLLYDSTWYSSYRAEPEVLQVGTKKKAGEDSAATTTTTATPPSRSTPPATTAPASAGR
ncbi:MAG TPA: VanW family protein [Gaiellaceae bacterium]|nr:VanW family protein [Gaiellaceae bacterium]